MLPSARGLCCPCYKQILEEAGLVKVIVVPKQVLTQWHIVFISCITGMLRRGVAERKASPGDCTVV